MGRRLFAWLCLLAAGPAAAASGPLAATGPRAPGVPHPSAVLGFELGSRPAHHAAILEYAERLAAASPRVRLERYAQSHEGRDLVVLVVSSERNLERLDAIREAVSTLADASRPLEPGALDSLLDATPAVAYLAYAIHGDEASSADAALRVAYELASGEREEIRKLRDELVVLVDPCENPDGRERFLAQLAAFAGAVESPDPEALAHTGVWPWGRGNHYLFDLNRDWFALVHPESRGRARLLRDWRPQLVVDSHEMGAESTYLFSPPRAPFNPNLPAGARDWWERFAADQARAFDRHGWSYYSREWNEEFYPGYGSSLALYQGAVGILYEQAGSDGQSIRKLHGGVLSYPEAVAHHYVSSLANLETAAASRRELLRSYRDARAEAIRRGRQGVRAWYFASPRDPALAVSLANRLGLLGIRVERLSAAGTVAQAHHVWEDRARSVRLEPGTFRVRLDQPDGLLARAVLEPHTPMPDSFLAEERQHLERQRETRVYDVTAWSPLLAEGLEAWWSAVPDGLAWEGAAALPPPAGVTPAECRAGYGWLVDGGSRGALLLASQLAARGFAVRAGEKPFELAGRAFPRGSFLVRAEENDAGALCRALGELVPGTGVVPVATDTARVRKGPDLGGDLWPLLAEARIAMASGSPLRPASVGEVWHLLDRELGLRASQVDLSRLPKTDLRRYNVLVLPEAAGGAEAYRRALGEPGLRALRTWVEQGGTLVAIGNGAELVAERASRLSKVRLRREALEDLPAPIFGLTVEAVRALERLQGSGLRPDGKGPRWAGPVGEEGWPSELGIPGPGSPVLGPGTWDLLGAEGERARKRAPLAPAEPAKAARKQGRGAPGAVKPRSGEGPGEDEGEDAAKPVTETEEERERQRADERLRRLLPSGAILRVDLDPEHWLAWGAGERVAVMAKGGESLLARDPAETAGRFADPDHLHLGGLLWPEAAGRIAHTAFLSREARGRGQIVLFAEDPVFRGYFRGSERLLLNALLLGPGLGTERTVPW